VQKKLFLSKGRGESWVTPGRPGSRKKSAEKKVKKKSSRMQERKGNKERFAEVRKKKEKAAFGSAAKRSFFRCERTTSKACAHPLRFKKHFFLLRFNPLRGVALRS
jgi:hypothetical protein